MLLDGEPTDLTLHLAGGHRSTTTREKKVWIRLESVAGDFSTDIQVTTTKKVGMLPPMLFMPHDYPHLRDINLTEKLPVKREMSIDVLLGEPHYSHLLRGGPVLGELNEPGAQRTKLGWALCAADPSHQAGATVHRVQAEEKASMDSLNRIMAKFYDLETLGVKPPVADEEKHTVEELAALKAFENGASFDPEAKKWTVRLPWKDPKPETNAAGQLGNNFKRAVAIMHRVEERTKPEDREAVNHAFQELVSKGWAERVLPESRFPDHFWYCLITKPVIRWEKETTPVRIVMDAGCKDPASKLSLNDMLHQGPCLLPEVAEVLIRFRQFRWAFTLDISKMFFQILVHEDDRDALRFVWRDFNAKSVAEIYRMVVFAFGLKPSPFVAINCVYETAKKHKLEFPEAVALLLLQLYMDDCPGGDHKKDKAQKLVRDLRNLLAKGSFRAHKFCANHADLLVDLDTDDQLHVDVTKILGVTWKLQPDEFTFDFEGKVQAMEMITKRRIMSQAAQLFDILGLVQPFILQYKLILQEVWLQKLGYDDEMPDNLKKRWIKWQEQIPDLAKVRIPRWTHFSPGSKAFLAVFGDASENAYGAVAYLVVHDGAAQSSTIEMAKSRLPPKSLKPEVAAEKKPGLTIVRLELLAALLATHVGTYVAKALKMDQADVHYFTDSLVNLLRIQGGAQNWKQWVANRIRQILTVSSPAQWHFCPGVENPADLASRGCSVADLLASPVWWEGPEWLRKEKSDWPEQPVRRKTDEEKLIDQAEAKAEDEVQIYAVQVAENQVLRQLVDRLERLPKILRVLALVKRFISNLRSKGGPRMTGGVTVPELQTAEAVLVRHAQRTEFGLEIASLKRGNKVNKNSPIRDLDPTLQDGVVVHRSRLRQAESLPFARQELPILPKNHPITTKIVLAVHRANMHSGTETTHLLIRRKYWIIGGRQQIRKIIRTCKAPKCRPVATLAVKMAPLPVERLDKAAAFTNVAMDFFGPIMVKHQCGKANCGHGESKAYGLVLTCFHSRAVHLELVPDLTTESFLMAFRRFAGRRGVPTILYSDNARTFTKANKELKALTKLDTDGVQAELTSQMGCEWHFSKAKAPWENGIAERMVQSVKRSLRKALHASLMTHEELATTLVEVEALINNRPLSCVRDESLLPITPAELVAGRPLTALPDPRPGMANDPELDFASLWRKRKAVMNSFWRRWRRDYLMELSPLKKWRQRDERPVRVGDVVLLFDQDSARNAWRLARVLETYQNEQGVTTSAKVKMPSGRPIHRSLRQLAILEEDMAVRGPMTPERENHGQAVEEAVAQGLAGGQGQDDGQVLRRSSRKRNAPTRLSL